MFQRFFGKSVLDDQCSVDDVGLKMDSLQRFNHLLSVVYSGNYAPSIYCGEGALHLDEKDENGEAVFINTEDEEQREFSMMLGDYDTLCADPTVLAALQTPDDDNNSNEDWIFFCRRAFESWGTDRLVNFHGAPASHLEGQSLDGILSSSPEADLLHELTHSVDIFSVRANGRDMQSDDQDLRSGAKAYKFHGVTTLAEENADDPVVMLRNAETSMYHAAVSLLKQCWWYSGTCEALTQVNIDQCDL
ncbi:hypothetical protein N7492_006345 [Penicillium capsulatum]|uniref:Uncharacterized protein n=1 Tax=Penicillium capsulatum TaxID=69766 RepID=A0A9W9I196_9EURO|nr:hypothetical protein N7492_006345 [Penicillium capsulatum]KAJ6108994.1 hypothetical protein N7512_008831 [Penicillium capsulatum]